MGINKYNSLINDNKGVSIISINTEQGRKIFDKINSSVLVTEQIIGDYADYAFSIKLNDEFISKRDEAFDEYKKLGQSNFIKNIIEEELQKQIEVLLKNINTKTVML